MENMITVTFNKDVIDSANTRFDDKLESELKEAFEQNRPNMPVAFTIGIVIGIMLGFTPNELMSESEDGIYDLIGERASKLMAEMAPGLEEALNNE